MERNGLLGGSEMDIVHNCTPAGGKFEKPVFVVFEFSEPSENLDINLPDGNLPHAYLSSNAVAEPEKAPATESERGTQQDA